MTEHGTVITVHHACSDPWAHTGRKLPKPCPHCYTVRHTTERFPYGALTTDREAREAATRAR